MLCKFHSVIYLFWQNKWLTRDLNFIVNNKGHSALLIMSLNHQYSETVCQPLDWQQPCFYLWTPPEAGLPTWIKHHTHLPHTEITCQTDSLHGMPCPRRGSGKKYRCWQSLFLSRAYIWSQTQSQSVSGVRFSIVNLLLEHPESIRPVANSWLVEVESCVRQTGTLSRFAMGKLKQQVKITITNQPAR